MSHNIVVMPGDGSGPEAIEAAVSAIEKVGEFSIDERDIGGIAIDKYGEPLPAATLEACLGADAVLLGAVGGPEWESDDPEAPRPEQGLLVLRKGLRVNANLRPTEVPDGLAGSRSFKRRTVKGTDFVIVRELLGGIYFGEKGHDETGTYDVCHYTDDQIKDVGRIAFKQAVERSAKSGLVPRLVSVDKANVLETSRRWRKLMDQLGEEEYPEVFLSHMLVDNAAQQINIRPRQFDVIVTENMFGDILSDQAATLSGSLGVAPSASLGPEGPGLFEPVHGSAPDIAGKGIVNPIATVRSAVMMLEELGMAEEAAALGAATEATLRSRFFQRHIRTPDIGGWATTRQVTRAITRRL